MLELFVEMVKVGYKNSIELQEFGAVTLVRCQCAAILTPRTKDLSVNNWLIQNVPIANLNLKQ